MKQPAAQIQVDVRVGEDLRRVFLTPRRRGDRNLVGLVLREALGEVPVRRAPEGYSVAGYEAGGLLGDLRPLRLAWREGVREFVQNRLWARSRVTQIREEVAQLRTGGASAARDSLRDVRGLDVLDDHQWVDVAAMTLPDSPGLCLFDEQGAGKTVSTIFAFDVLAARDEVDSCLIIAPKSMIPEWERDIRTFKGDLYTVSTAAGSRQEKLAAIATGTDVLVTNFETAVSMEAELRARLRRSDGRALLVIDESFFVKNLDAKRTRALCRLREWCRRAYVLSGTPAPNSVHDIVQQHNIVDFGMAFGGTSIPEDSAGALAMIRRILQDRGLFLRSLKADALPDLPSKTFQRVTVPLQPQQEQAYREALNDFIVDLRQMDDHQFGRQIASVMARRMALLQICSNPTTLVPGYDETPAKLLALDSLLDELVRVRGEKVVVWSFFTASVDAIFTRYAELRPLRYDGQVQDVDLRREAVRLFQEDDEHMLFVGNPAAAGAGLTLHRARYAVYESLSNQAAHYLQSIDRIHRRGQERPVEYLLLLCDRSIEVTEYDRLGRKERAAQDLLGDRVDPPVTRETLLSEALEAKELLA